MEATLMNIPYALGYSPQWWRQGTNCMIEKKLGKWRVNRLHTIFLYEADFNFLNKKLGRDALRQAED